jgi:DNA-binding NarL/FixJ family response regulator
MSNIVAVLIDPDRSRREALGAALGASGALRVLAAATVAEADALVPRAAALVLLSGERGERADLARLRARAPEALLFCLHAPEERDARRDAHAAGFDGALPWAPVEALGSSLRACVLERP